MESSVNSFQVPNKIRRAVRRITRQSQRFIYLRKLKLETYFFNLRPHQKNIKNKCLYMSPVGKDGKAFLAKIVQQFGYDECDFLIVVYDDTTFNEDVFKKCTFIYDRGLKWHLVKKYVLPGFSESYDYIFLWDDDIDINGFELINFIDIIKRNNIQLAQPALSQESYYSHKITLIDNRYKVGRYTDFAEIMVPVFDSEIWPKFWNMIEESYNYWGWGYDMYAKTYLGLTNIAIVDQETVTHTKPLRGRQADSHGDYEKFMSEKKHYKIAELISYDKLK